MQQSGDDAVVHIPNMQSDMPEHGNASVSDSALCRLPVDPKNPAISIGTEVDGSLGTPCLGSGVMSNNTISSSMIIAFIHNDMVGISHNIKGCMFRVTTDINYLFQYMSLVYIHYPILLKKNV